MAFCNYVEFTIAKLGNSFCNFVQLYYAINRYEDPDIGDLIQFLNSIMQNYC